MRAVLLSTNPITMLALMLAIACGSGGDDGDDPSGGVLSSAGSDAGGTDHTGGGDDTGGRDASGGSGGNDSAGGNDNTGGVDATGGDNTGGIDNTGGVVAFGGDNSGGVDATGGDNTGGDGGQQSGDVGCPADRPTEGDACEPGGGGLMCPYGAESCTCAPWGSSAETWTCTDCPETMPTSGTNCGSWPMACAYGAITCTCSDFSSLPSTTWSCRAQADTS
jgi:hypothetical protein